MSKSKSSRKLDMSKLSSKLQQAKHYSLIAFILIVAGIYAFVMLRITSLSSLEPTDDAVNSQVKAASVPHIDQQVVNQLKSLQDNSVNVQSLFNEARTSPFHEEE